MMLISGVSTGAVQPLETTGKAQGASKVQRPQEETQDRQPKPVMDEYVPEEPQEPFGRYWVGKDEDGQPRIYFDDPERAEDAPEQPKGKKDKDEVWECNTDKVDREIEKLKEKRQELEQCLNTETDEAKIKELESQMTQVEMEVEQKDNDTYRKQNSIFTQLS